MAAAQPSSEVFEHGIRQYQNQRAHPAEIIRPCGAEALVLEVRTRRRTKRGTRALFVAGRGCVDTDDSEDEAQRSAGGSGPKSSTLAERRALPDRMMAPADFAPLL